MKIDIEGFEGISFNESDYKKAVNKATKKSIKKTERFISKQVIAKYNIAERVVKEASKTSFLSGGGEINYKSKVLGLPNFKISQNKSGVEAEVEKGKKYKIQGAFIKSTNNYAGKYKGGATKYSDEKELRVLKRENRDRYPLREYSGASIPGLVQSEAIQKNIDEYYEKQFKENIVKELDKI